MTNAEIRAGEYVRLARNQGINKIISSDDDFYVLDENIADEYGYLTSILYKNQISEEVINHSFNLIDLIEVGDYVNGDFVQEIKEIINNEMVCMLNSDYEYYSFIKNQDIKTIVTHEQFKSMEYEVGEEDD